MTRERAWFILALLILFVLAIALAVQFSSQDGTSDIEESQSTLEEPSAGVDAKQNAHVIQDITVNDDCLITGCSNQVCTDNRELATTCEWHETYSCYNNATCERQPDGECGWTRTEEIMQCIRTLVPEMTLQ